MPQTGGSTNNHTKTQVPARKNTGACTLYEIPQAGTQSLTSSLACCQQLVVIAVNNHVLPPAKADDCKMEGKTQKRRASGTSRQTHGQSRVLATPAQTYVSSGRDMYGYLAMGFALCMFIYFFGNPTSSKLELFSPSTGLPQQIPPSLSLQPPNHPILEPARKAQEHAKMSNVERT